MVDENKLRRPLNDQKLRMLYEACEQAGITAALTKEDILRKFEALERGLPAEDEFVVLVSWLGKCKLIHKLDQDQSPTSSDDLYQVPDLLAIFEYENHDIPVLIEVKTTKDPSLEWTANYFSRITRYADQLNMPLLIAWKYRPEEVDWSFWTLFDSHAFTRPHISYKITLEDASQESLLGQLAGEFALDVKAGVGLHFTLDLIGDREDWQGMKGAGKFFGKMNVYWTDGNGNEISFDKLSEGLNAILNCIPPMSEYSRSETDSSVVWIFALNENLLLFGQHILPILLTSIWSSKDDELRWRGVLKRGNLPVSSKEICEAAEAANGIVNFIFHQVPKNVPAFLK